MSEPTREEIAIVGMAGRFPGATSVDELWDNLCAGVESIRPFTPEELAAAGIGQEEAAEDGYVAAGAPLEHADAFDASFFGYARRESEIMDPQHRVFLECAWAALEDAGYDPATAPGRIGLFGGVAPNTYRQQILETRPDVMAVAGRYPLMIGSEREYAITRVAFKLDLQGPAVAVHTACSTSGVALHMACQSVLSGESDMALAGGGRIHVPLAAGYLYEEDGILSPDGHCRVFDARGRGTVVGNGMAILVVKRLSDAVADGDSIRAIVKGTAINNDGSDKIGFTAPSVRGQMAVIQEALDMAEVDAATIGYVEAHGTGTFIGDPIEVEALTRAYRRDTDAVAYCGIGSIKSNIGHLDAGAGAAGVIKAVRAMETGIIPPSLHFEDPNPQIDFATSPFRVVDRLSEWPATDGPRRAAVSSFGLGGTNAHIVLEQAPPAPSVPTTRSTHLLTMSARTPAALERASDALAAHLQADPDVDLGDVAHTLLAGRRAFEHRRTVAARHAAEAASALTERNRLQVATGEVSAPAPIVFMFPGVGSQYPGMGRDLYDTEPVFRRWFDVCAELAGEPLGVDIQEVVYRYDDEDRAAASLARAKLTMPSLFAVEYSCAKLLESVGIVPDAMIGHSLGEYTAAALAGVLSLEDAMSLVVTRGLLFDRIPDGSMLIVPLPESEVETMLGPDLSLAVVNRPDLCVVAGEVAAVDRLASDLEEAGVEARRVAIAAPTHSHLIDPVLAEFADFTKTIPVSEPQIPVISGTTGTWLTAEEALDPTYWARHLRHTVRFHDGLSAVLADGDRTLIEVGPGQTMSVLARRHPAKGDSLVTSTMRHPREAADDATVYLTALGRLWAAGADVDLAARYTGEERRRIPLPTYPFERQRYWIEPGVRSEEGLVPPPYTVPAETTADVDVDVDEGLTRPDRLLAEVRAVFCELSGVDQAELDADLGFLELGFDSLFMSQASRAIGDRYGLRISFRQLFEEAPTLRALAGFLDGRLQADPSSAPTDSSTAAPASSEGDDEMLIAVTESQREILLAAAADDGANCAFNLATVLHVEGRVDEETLQRTVDRLVADHDALRIRFDPRLDHQRIAPSLDLAVEFTDLSSLDPAVRTQRLSALKAGEVETPFDLVEGPLVRIGLVRLGDDEHLVTVTVHHAVCDPWSSRALVRRLAELYTQERRHDEAEAGDTMQFVDYLEWLQALRTPADVEADRLFWAGHAVDGFPATDLPSDRPRPQRKEYLAHGRHRRLDAELTKRLVDASAVHGVSLYTLMLSSFETLLAGVTGSEELGVAISVGGHTRLPDTTLVGHTLNVLPLRRTVPPGRTFRDHLQETRSAFFDAFDHQDFTYGTVVRSLRPAGRGSRPSLVTAVLDMRLGPESLEMDGASVWGEWIEPHYAIFDAHVDIIRHADHLELSMRADRSLFDPETIDGRLAEWERLLRTLTEQGTDLTIAGLLESAEVGAVPPPAAPSATSAAEVSPVAPRTDLERDVSSLWSAVLGIDTVGVEVDFFDVGGDSLGMVELASRLEVEVGVRLALPALFKARTVADQAVLVTEALLARDLGEDADLEALLAEVATSEGGELR